MNRLMCQKKIVLNSMIFQPILFLENYLLLKQINTTFEKKTNLRIN